VTTYDSLDEMWYAMLETLLRSGKQGPSRCGDMAGEVIGSQWRLRAGCDATFLCNPRRALDPVYASAELLWYLSRSDSGAGLLPYAPKYEMFLDEDGRAFGAYGHRILTNAEGRDLLEEAVGLLRKSPETRQCVVQIWRPTDLCEAVRGGRKDLPCTLSWQFVVRDGALHMCTTMRSNDAWLGTPYDVYCFTCIQRLVAGTLGVAVGEYVHTVGSLHLYAKNARAAREAFAVANDRGFVIDQHNWSPAGLEEAPDAVNAEKCMRTNEGSWSYKPAHTLLHDAVSCVSWHWGLNSPVQSDALAHALGAYSRKRKEGK
jgi:thymidylate synthase